MRPTDDRLDELRRFGLSEYAARAYLALLDLGFTEARDISRLAKIPLGKIYHTLDQLHERGLVQVIPESPKKFAPVPFSEYLDKLRSEHAQAIHDIELDRTRLESLLHVRGDTEVGDRGSLTIVRGRRNVLGKIRELIESTRSDLLLAPSKGFTLRLDSSLPSLHDAVLRGVRVRVLSHVAPDTIPRLAHLAEVVDVRARDFSGTTASHVGIHVFDGERAILAHFIPDDASLYKGKDVAFLTDHNAMVEALASILEPHWSSAVPFERRRRELERGALPEFTRVCSTQAETMQALAAAIARGVRDYRSVLAEPAAPMNSWGRAIFDRLRVSAERARILINVADLETLDWFTRLQAEAPHVEFRHLSSGVLGRFAVVDEREAFFSVGAARTTSWGPADDAGSEPDCLVHTSNLVTVRSLSAHIEALWAKGVPLAVHRRTLESFPRLPPNELEPGWLLQSIPDAVAVVDVETRILLWNRAGALLFGIEAGDAVRMRLADVLVPDAAPELDAALARVLRATPGAADARATFTAHALSRGRGVIPVDLTLGRIEAAAGAMPLVLVLAREAAPPK